MENSYNETVQRCKMLQESFDAAEKKHKDDVKKAELEIYKLKERLY